MESKNNEHIRIDKWLWAVRIFKTRNMAANACKKSKVLLNGRNVKPSHAVKIGDVIEVRHSIITRTFNVNGLLEKRVSAKIAVDYVEETTPPEEFRKLRIIKDTPFALREKGTGRPTKKDRREITRLKNKNVR
jgi:ribosome-associated heat shock protein Hsp15